MIAAPIIKPISELQNDHCIAHVHCSMLPCPALALIRPRQLLSLFTVHFHVHALQMIIPKIGHSAKKTQLELRLPTIFPIIPPSAKHPKHCFDSV